MKFLKQNRKYLTSELHGNISNIMRFELKDLYKAQKTQDFELCPKCQTLLAFKKCLLCGCDSQSDIDEIEKRNFICQQVIKNEKKSFQSMILCIDMSGSMNCSYPTKYKKINKDYVIRSLGLKNFTTIASIITQAEVIKHFKGIQVLLQSGQSIRDIAYTFKGQILREKQMNYEKSKNSQSPAENQSNSIQEQENWQYITRKQIIEVGISKYIEQIKKQRPNTLITVVYFNSNIEIPVENFSDKLIIPGLETRTIEQMIELGQIYADQISIQPVTEVGEKLITNMARTEAEGQTALTPALAFSIGLAKKFKHDLHQMQSFPYFLRVLVTDGLSNIGFGQTEEKANLEQSKAIFKKLAFEYAVPNACVVNVIGFQDCAISYDVIDQIVSKTGGIPYSISFSVHKEQKVVTNETIDFLNLEMITGFCQGTRQFCYETKISIRANNKNIKFHCPEEYKKFIKFQEQNILSLELGIKSINDKWDFMFTVDNENFEDEYIKFSVIAQYKKKNKVMFALRQEIVSVRKGEEQQAIKDQSNALTKEIVKKLQVHKIEEQNFQQYKQLEQKINQNAKISQNIDQTLLQKFRKKKQYLDEYDKTTDKLTKDKRSMMSRRHQTYKRRQINEEDQEQSNGFL